MTAPARQGASPEPARRAGSPPPPSTNAGPRAERAESVAPVAPVAAGEVAERASRLLWASVIAVMVLATALTMAILLLQWLSTSSGTVGR